jgi:molybdopterin-binding protein
MEQTPALTESAVRKMALDAGKDPDAVVDAARKNKLLQ